jgi:hypothetical protein
MASLATVTGVFEKILRKGIGTGVFADVDSKLVALNALFLCHQWSLHRRALRSITQNVDEFFELQSGFMLQGLLSRSSKVKSGKTRRRQFVAEAAPVHGRLAPETGL